MEFADGLRLSRILLAAGAVLAVAGLVMAFAASRLAGALILIAGIALLAIGSTLSRFYRLYDLQTAVMRRKRKDRE